MNLFKHYRFRIILLFLLIIVLTASLFAGATDPPNFTPGMTIQYKDPQTKKQIVHEVYSYAEAHRTYQVPGGAELTLIFEAINTGDNPGGDGVSVDVWLDWTDAEMPADESDADFVCISEDPSDCYKFKEVITADANFKGSDGKGVYNVLIWVDRFDTQTEVHEDDNIMGPIKIVAAKILYLKESAQVKPKPPVLITPDKIKKISP